ncbi:hypothetical protein [Microbacterium album]|uniref:Replicase polyprotein 1ab n=1 Tax=Microbacterium album TaxID=2053191 RepID=A0A917IEX2_9MICO|nr:hypothetical protein [Microbacterium album]GGH46152.1 hypothetical protein GCM10010921_22040 [Microbacterium album]
MRIPDPPLPDEIQARDLPGSARNELKTLSKENAERVARHLAMAARSLDEAPELAHEHALAAVRHAGRVAVARETLAITAYTIGDYALALRELRTHRRITGRDDLIALIVDSERGMGRPERALEEGRAVDRDTLSASVRVELAIAMSGARLDLGQTQLALVELDIPELDPDRAFEWSPGLFAARANVLEDLCLKDEAAQWRRRAEIAEEVLGGDQDEFDIVELDDADTEQLPVDLDSSDDGDEVGEETESAEAPAEIAGEDVTVEDEDELTVEDEVAEILAEVDGAPEAGAGEADGSSAIETAAEPGSGEGTAADSEEGDRPDGALF